MKKRKARRLRKRILLLGGLITASLCVYWGVQATKGADWQPEEGQVSAEGSVFRKLGGCLKGGVFLKWGNLLEEAALKDGFPKAVDAASSLKDNQEDSDAAGDLEQPSIEEIRRMPAGAVLSAVELSQEEVGSLFYSMELPEEVRQRIWGVSYHENENISMEDLRYLRVLHIGFDGQAHIGELIVNRLIAEDILEIMQELYRQSYPIEKMLLVDAYGADDGLSMADNNTSAFNYREIAGSGRLSNHAKGLAIDINPLYNPYVKQTGDGQASVSPPEGAAYADRSLEFPYKIEGGDLCCRLFGEHGFAWGGDWRSVKDYQHFEYAG